MAAIVAAWPGQELRAQELPKEVRFAFLNGPRPWILGKIDKSFDKALGVPVNWIGFPSGPPALTALAAGEVDIVRVGCVPVTSFLSKKVPLTVIGIAGVIDTSERLVAKNAIKSMVAADSGMGWVVMNASSYMRTDLVLLGIILLGVTGYLLDYILVLVERACVPWAGKE